MTQFTMWLLIVLLALLSFVLVGAIFEPFWFLEFEIISQLSGLSSKSDVLKYLGIGIGGLVLMLQALIANRRAKALEVVAKTQADAVSAQARATDQQAKANQLTERGLRQERLKNAIEHLGNQSESVRLGAAYELFHLAEEAMELGQTVMDILCAHIRRTTREDEYQKKYPSQPSEEVQSLLTLLFVQEHEVFVALRINLRESWLCGADLRGARLPGANLRRAQLNKAILNDAFLQKVVLEEAQLKEAWLLGACLREAQLYSVQMQGANLTGAQLQGANIEDGNLTAAQLIRAHLQGALLVGTYLHGANLGGVELQGAQLKRTYLQGAYLAEANLQGAGKQDWDSSTPFTDRIRRSIGRETSLSEQVIDSGITEEFVEQRTSELLSESKKTDLRATLGKYTDEPQRRSLELPENHGAILGSYTKEEAEQWIAEHRTALAVTDK